MIPVPGTNYCGPFSVHVSMGEEVIIYDADGCQLLALNTHTQSPLDDDEAMAAELAEAQAMADFIVAALNAYLEKK